MHYVISDIHGCRKQFLNLLEKIQFSESDTLFILGDVLDRGFDPIRTLQDIMQYKNTVFILGNHEYLFYYFLKRLGLDLQDFQDEEDKWDFRSWLKDGSLPTMDGFLELTKEEKQKIMDYLENASVYEEFNCNGKRYVLVHAGIYEFQEDKALHEYDCLDFVSGRTDYKTRYFKDENTFLVTGHTPTPNIREDRKPEVYFGNGHIAIDCGCVYGGKLAVFCLETEEVFYVDGVKNRHGVRKPKYKKGDIVKFYHDIGKEKIDHYGKIEIIDAYGTWGQSEEVSYDIMGLDENCLFKHVVESDVYGFHETNEACERH